MAAYKSTLEDTDYEPYIKEDSDMRTVTSLTRRLKDKLANEIFYLIANSVPPLNDFLKLTTVNYMIDNTVNIIEGLKNQRDMD